MDYLTLFGLIAVTAMLVFYALEDHSPWFNLAFAVACALGPKSDGQCCFCPREIGGAKVSSRLGGREALPGDVGNR